MKLVTHSLERITRGREFDAALAIESRANKQETEKRRTEAGQGS